MTLYHRLRDREISRRSGFNPAAFFHSHLAHPPVLTSTPPRAELDASSVAEPVGDAYCGFTATAVMKGHFGCVNALSISHGSGQWIATGSDDARVLIWNAFDPVSDTGLCSKPVAVYRGHIRNIFCTAFTCDDRKILSCGIDETIRMYDLETGGSGVSRVGNSAVRAAIGADGEIDFAGRSERVFTEHAGSVHRISPVSDSPHLFLSASSDHSVRVWDTRSGESAVHIIRFRAGMNSVASCPVNGHLFATGGDRLFISDLRRLPASHDADRPITILPALAQYYTGIREVASIDWSRDGQRLVSCLMKSYPLVFDVCGDGGSLPGLVTSTSLVDEKLSSVLSAPPKKPVTWNSLNRVPLVYATYRLCGTEYRNVCTMRAAAFIGAEHEMVACGSDTFSVCIWDISNTTQKNRSRSYRHRPTHRHTRETGNPHTPPTVGPITRSVKLAQSKPSKEWFARTDRLTHNRKSNRNEFGSDERTTGIVPCAIARGHRSIPNHVTYHPTLHRMYSGGVEKCVRVWSLARPFARSLDPPTSTGAAESTAESKSVRFVWGDIAAAAVAKPKPKRKPKSKTAGGGVTESASPEPEPPTLSGWAVGLPHDSNQVELELRTRKPFTATQIMVLLGGSAPSDDENDSPVDSDDERRARFGASDSEDNSDSNSGSDSDSFRRRRNLMAPTAADGDAPDWYEVDETDTAAVLARVQAFGHSGGLDQPLTPVVLRRIARAFARYQHSSAEAALAATDDSDAKMTVDSKADGKSDVKSDASAESTGLIADLVRFDRLPELFEQFGGDLWDAPDPPPAPAVADTKQTDSKTADPVAAASETNGTRRPLPRHNVEEDIKVLAQFDYLLLDAKREPILSLEVDDGEDMDPTSWYTGGSRSDDSGGSDAEDDASGASGAGEDENARIGGESNDFLQRSNIDSKSDSPEAAEIAREMRARFLRTNKSDDSESGSSEDESEAAAAAGTSESGVDFHELLRFIDARIAARSESKGKSGGRGGGGGGGGGVASSNQPVSLRSAFVNARDDGAATFTFGGSGTGLGGSNEAGGGAESADSNSSAAAESETESKSKSKSRTKSKSKK